MNTPIAETPSAIAKQADVNLITKVEQAWQDRCKSMGYTKKRALALQTEFFVGAMSVLAAQGHSIPVYWVIAIQIGRPIGEPTP